MTALQNGITLKVTKLREQSEVMWLNPVEENLAKGLKKGQGPLTACLGEKQFFVSHISQPTVSTPLVQSDCMHECV